jgi:phage shock protein E
VASGYQKISAKEAKEIMESNEEIVILDVRGQSEYDHDGHIQNSILIPHTEIENKALQTLPNKDAKILVYCRSGGRSGLAGKTLSKMGYTNVLDFGGILDWPYEIVR